VFFLSIIISKANCQHFDRLHVFILHIGYVQPVAISSVSIPAVDSSLLHFNEISYIKSFECNVNVFTFQII